MCYNDTASRDSVVRYSIFTDKKRTNMYENDNGHLDGTLLNTLGDLCDSVTYAVEKHGFPPVSMEQTRIRIGNGVRKLVERSIPEESRTDEMIDICLADFRAFYGAVEQVRFRRESTD